MEVFFQLLQLLIYLTLAVAVAFTVFKRFLFGYNFLLVKDQFGVIRGKKIKSISDIEIVTKDKMTYPLVDAKSIRLPFFRHLRFYVVDFALEEYRIDHDEMVLFMRTNFIKELSRNPISMLGVIQLGLSILCIVLLFILLQGQGDVVEGIRRITEMFSGLSGV